MTTLQFLLVLPGSVASVVTLALQVSAVIGGWNAFAAKIRSRRLKARMLGRTFLGLKRSRRTRNGDRRA